MDIALLYITTPSRDVALNLARLALNQRLAACANIVDSMTSLYRWEGKLCEETEVVLLLKTQKDLAGTLRQAIADAHPYEIPCIVEIPISNAHPEFQAWVTDETTPPS